MLPILCKKRGARKGFQESAFDKGVFGKDFREGVSRKGFREGLSRKVFERSFENGFRRKAFENGFRERLSKTCDVLIGLIEILSINVGYPSHK